MPVFTPPTRFVGLSLYAVLGVNTSASTDDIKRGYRRAALKFHPDHNHSPDANDEFGYLAHAHDILSNTHTRTLYDETGVHDSSSSSTGAASDSSVSSADYWRSVFPQVSVDEIEAFRVKYVGSEEEVEDIKAAYERYEGDVQHVLDSIPFAESDSVARLCGLLNEQCGARITAQQQRRLQKKAERWQRQEQAEFEQLTLSGSAEQKEAAQSAGDMTQLVALLARRKEEAEQKQEQWLNYMTDKYGGGADSKRKRLTKGTADDSQPSKAKGRRRAGKGTGNGGGGTGEEGEKEERKEVDGERELNADEPSEEEFQRIQADMLKRREANKAKGTTSSSSHASSKKVSGAAGRDKKRKKTST